MTEKLQMSAYYYSFQPTGCEPVDKILSAVAMAGKGLYHTEHWAENWGNDVPTCVERIQEAANNAAKEFSVHEAPNDNS